MFTKFSAQFDATGFDSYLGTYVTDDPEADPALRGVERSGGGSGASSGVRLIRRVSAEEIRAERALAARLAEPKELPKFRDVVEDRIPDLSVYVLGDPESSNTQAMNVALGRVREAVASIYNAEGIIQERNLAALTPSMWAAILLRIYRSNENAQFQISPYNVMEFLSKLAGDQDSINPSREDAEDYRRRGSHPRHGVGYGEDHWSFGGVQRFEKYVRGHSDYTAPRGKDIGDDDWEMYYEFIGAAFEAMEEIHGFLMGPRSVNLRSNIIEDVAEFLVAYLLAIPEAQHFFGLSPQVRGFYQDWAEKNQNGAYVEIGPGQSGIDLLQVLPDRDTVLIEYEPLMAKVLARFAQMRGYSRAQIVLGDIAHVTLTEGFAGVVHAHFSLHYLALADIPDVIAKLVAALPPGGVLAIEEPASGCCPHSHPNKVKAIEEALASHGLKVRKMTQNRDTPDPIYGGVNTIVEVTFIARKPE